MRKSGLLAFYLAMVSWATPVMPQSIDDAPSLSPRLSLCIVSGEANLFSWRQTNIRDIFRVLDEAQYSSELRVRVAPCNETMPDTSCAAVTGELFCRSGVLDRIQTSAAWLAERYVSSGKANYEEFRLASDIRPGVEFNFSALPAGTDSDVSGRVGSIHYVIENDIEVRDNDALTRKVELQRAIADIAITALIGHEVHHMNGERCPVTQNARVEQNGLITVAERIQVTDELFKAAYPDPNEYKADRCAFRQISRLSFENLSDEDERFARRAGADLMSFLFGIGLRVESLIQRERFRTAYLDSYIMPPLRVTLFAAEVAPEGANVPVCGRSAQLFASFLGDYFSLLPGDGLVPDDLLDQYPEQLERSFNGEPWSPMSFSCN